MSMHYPEQPDQNQKEKMMKFIDGFAEFYPCKFCKAHFQKDIIENPPQVNSRRDFSLWLCNQHNKTNWLLGKEEFPCDEKSLNKWWYENENECQERDYWLNN